MRADCAKAYAERDITFEVMNKLKNKHTSETFKQTILLASCVAKNNRIEKDNSEKAV